MPPELGSSIPGTGGERPLVFSPVGDMPLGRQRRAECGGREHTDLPGSSGPTSVPPGTPATPKPQFFQPQKHKWSLHTGPPEGHPSRYSWFPCVSGMAIGDSGLRGEILCDERHLRDAGLQMPWTSECGHEPWWEWVQVWSRKSLRPPRGRRDRTWGPAPDRTVHKPPSLIHSLSYSSHIPTAAMMGSTRIKH